METGAITSYFDVAQVVLYGFWFFFAGIIYYLLRENKREGYPLESEGRGSVRVQGFPAIPEPKVYRLANGTTVAAPPGQTAEREIKAVPSAAWPGSPLEPTGDPMVDGVGPASYALRHEAPDMTLEGLAMMVPMRIAPEFSVAEGDADPRGMWVLGADGLEAGKVSDIWVDRAEPQIRYLEVALDSPAGPQSVLLPITLARIDSDSRRVRVQSIKAEQFVRVPRLANPTEVTLREEDRITAYYASGNLYADPSRLEPIL